MVEGCGDMSHTTTSITYEVAREYLGLTEAPKDDPTMSPLTLLTLTTCTCTKGYTFHNHVQLVPLDIGMMGLYTSLSRSRKKYSILKTDIGL